MSEEHNQSLIVDEGDTVTLSINSERFNKLIRKVVPQSIAEVRKILGPSAREKESISNYNTCCAPSELSSQIISADDLESENPEIRSKAKQLAYFAAKHYVHAIDNKAVSHWETTLDRYIQLSKTIINICYLSDIDVYNHGKLNIASNVQALYARNIRLHGNGSILCNGPTTFNAASFEGNIMSKIRTRFNEDILAKSIKNKI
jgi:hypothetical protein